MTENFYLDNPDLQFQLEKQDLCETLDFKEKGYSLHETHPGAPRNYKDAKDNCRLILEILGEICAKVIAPRAAEADEEGAQYSDGEVRYSAPTLEALEALKQAELLGEKRELEPQAAELHARRRGAHQAQAAAIDVQRLVRMAPAHPAHARLPGDGRDERGRVEQAECVQVA
jgi:hypothetical protein